MRSNSRVPRVAASLCCLLLAAGGSASAVGTIPAAGATIAAGTPGQGASAGTVLVEPDGGPRTVPTQPSVPGIGLAPASLGDLPAFAAVPTGSTAFTAAADTAVDVGNGATLDYTTYTVAPNVTVTYSGPVTIRTSGNVQIGGVVTTTAANASITFRCGGDFAIASDPLGVAEGVLASGASAPVTIDVAKSVTTTTSAGARTQIRSSRDAVTVLSHSTAGGISLAGTDVRGATGVSMRASGLIVCSGAGIAADGGALTVQSRFGLGTYTATTISAFSGNILMEGAAGLRLASATDVYAEGTLRLRGFGDPNAGGAQDVVIDASSVTAFLGIPKWLRAAAAGDIEVSSTSGVRLLNSAFVEHDGTGSVSVTAFGTDVLLETPGSSGQSEINHGGVGALSVRALRDVGVRGASRFWAAEGALSVVASTGGASVAGSGSVTSDEGAAEIRAAAGVSVAPDASTGGGAPSLAAASWIVIGEGGCDFETSAMSASTGQTRILSPAAIRLRGSFVSASDVTVQALAGSIDLAGASVTTEAAGGGPSGRIRIESYSGDGTIDATGSTVRSGDSSIDASGDVTLIVYDAPPPVVRAYLVPAKASVKLSAADPALSTLTVSGTIDTGPTPVDLAGDATLTVGGVPLQVTLVADRKGVLRHRAPTLTLQVLPSKAGSSKAAFSLKRTGDLSALVDPAGNGSVRIDFAKSGIDAAGRFDLTKGKFAAGKVRGALAEPGLFLVSARAGLAGGGADTLRYSAGFAMNGPEPTTAPDVILGFGPLYSVTLASAVFGVPKKGVFIARKPAPGIVQVKLDFAKGTLTVVAKGIDLGAFAPDASVPVTVMLQLAKDLRRVELRAAHKGPILSY